MCTTTEHDQKIFSPVRMTTQAEPNMMPCPPSVGAVTNAIRPFAGHSSFSQAVFQPANEYEEFVFPSLVSNLMTKSNSKSKIVESRQCGVILTKHNVSDVSLEHYYEDILSPKSVNNNPESSDICRQDRNLSAKAQSDKSKFEQAAATRARLNFKSLSDTDLRREWRMADTELEVYTKVSTANFLEASPGAPLYSDRLGDTTFNTYGRFPEPEQGFYKCHDNLEDIDELDLIPEAQMFSARKSRQEAAKAETQKSEVIRRSSATEVNSVKSQKSGCVESEVVKQQMVDRPLSKDEIESDNRRNSFDSGRGSSTSTLIRSDKVISEDCASCMSISPAKLSLSISEEAAEADNQPVYENVYKKSPPPPPLPPKNKPLESDTSRLPALPPKPNRLSSNNRSNNNNNNVEESVRALQSLSNDLLGLIESTKKDASKAASGVTLRSSGNSKPQAEFKELKTPDAEEEASAKKPVARTLDFEQVSDEEPTTLESVKTPKAGGFRRNKGLLRSLRKDSPMKKLTSPSLSIVRKRKYLLCSPKVTLAKGTPDVAQSYRSQKSSPKSSPSKKKAKKGQVKGEPSEADKENTVDFSGFKTRALANNLPVIPFYPATPSVDNQTDDSDYMVMTPLQPSEHRSTIQSLTPLRRRESFLQHHTVTSVVKNCNSSHCLGCSCGNQHKTKNPAVSKFAGRKLPPPPVPMKHTEL